MLADNFFGWQTMMVNVYNFGKIMSLFSARSMFDNQLINPAKVDIDGEITGLFFAGKIEMVFINDKYPIDDFKILIGKNANSKICLHDFNIKVDENPFVLKILGKKEAKIIYQEKVSQNEQVVFGIGDDSYAKIWIPNILLGQVVTISAKFELSTTITINNNIAIFFPLTYPGLSNDDILDCSDFKFILKFPSYQLKKNSITSNPEGIIDLSTSSYLINELDQILTSISILINFNPPVFSENMDQILKSDDPIQNHSITCCGNYGLFTYVPNIKNGNDHSDEEFIFIVDCSTSMRGEEIKLAAQCLIFFIKSLPENCYFNVICFGGTFIPLFQRPVPYNDSNIKSAINLAHNLTANNYGTVLLNPLTYVFSKPISKPGKLRRLFILTDGWVENRTEVFNIIERNANTTVSNAIGIGYGADPRLVRGIGKYGNGYVDFVLSGDDMRSIVIGQLSKSLYGSLSVNISFENNESIEILPPLSKCYFSPENPITLYFKSDKRIDEKANIIIEIEGVSEPDIIEINPLPPNQMVEKSLEYLFNNENIKFLRSLDQTEEIASKINQLSIEYGILTPYTRLIGTQEYKSPEEKERCDKFIDEVEDKIFYIYIRPLEDETYKLLVDPNANIEDVKSLIQERSGIPPKKQRLIFAGKQLEDGNSLKDYLCKSGSMLHLLTELRGGGGVHVSYSKPYYYAKRTFISGSIDDLISVISEQMINGCWTNIPKILINLNKFNCIIQNVEDWRANKKIESRFVVPTISCLIFMKKYKKECYQMWPLIYKKGINYLMSIDSTINWEDIIQIFSDMKINSNGDEKHFKLTFEIDKDEKTASIIGYRKLTENVYISHKIEKDKEKYIITKISENSFQNSKIIKSVRFSSNSEVKTIEKCAFADSLIINLSIPASLIELKEGWCYKTPYLTNIIIQPNNSNFIYLDDKLILSKSNPKSDIFDILVFARRDIEEVKIPSFIEKIDAYAFADSGINKIFIPPNVKEIGEGAFSSCKKLQNVKISSKSKIKLIEDNVFADSPIKEILIPSHIEYTKK